MRTSQNSPMTKHGPRLIPLPHGTTTDNHDRVWYRLAQHADMVVVSAREVILPVGPTVLVPPDVVTRGSGVEASGLPQHAVWPDVGTGVWQNGY
jgi:hypothetical protein